MRFYHFTARRFAPSIRIHGLTKGVLPLTFERALCGYQWLTTNGSWDQDWAEGTGRLPYKRNEVRFTVDIPDKAPGLLRQLLSRKEWEKLIPVETVGILTSIGDPDNWHVFKGRIPREWLTKLDLDGRE